MGMDIYGKNGDYFRRNVWSWHPLADLCEWFAQDIFDKCQRWHSNDGGGLDGDDARALADALDTALRHGRVTAYIAERNAALAALPDQSCSTCAGSGIRTDAIGVDQGMITRVVEQDGHPRHGQTGWCNGCDGVGHARPTATWYAVTVDDVSEFVEFLRDCDGFEIW